MQSLCASPTTSSPRDQVSPTFFSTTLPPEMSTGPSSAGPSYGGNSSHVSPEPSLLYPPHVSPITELAQFHPECSPDSSPEIHRRPSLQEEQLQTMFLDAEAMSRYYPEPDMLYGVSPPLGPLQSPMYTVESSSMLGRGTSTFVGDPAQHDWATQSTSDVLLVSPHESVYSPGFGYSQSDSAESIDIYAPASYPINTYDSFEFQTLQEHTANAVLASQLA